MWITYLNSSLINNVVNSVIHCDFTDMSKNKQLYYPISIDITAKLVLIYLFIDLYMQFLCYI